MRLFACLLAAALGLSVACAPKQIVPLDVQPQPVEIFLDGKALEGTPTAIELRADRDHKLFFKSAGHRPELVVLETRERDGDHSLDPPAVRVRLLPARQGDGELQIEDDSQGP